MTTTDATLAAPAVLERFLRYVGYDTQSDPDSTSVPSTAKQLVLLDLLVEELKALGCEDAARDPHGIVMATVPPTTARPNVPVIGFLAHVDTSPELSGANVRPIVHRAWDGRDLVLPDDPTAVLRAAEQPELEARRGDDIVTASGTTLLGADDKAGVAEIMTAVEWLMRHPEVAHGAIRIGFTPDEEIGRGVAHFDVARFAASCAYTLDGESRGQLDLETFSADALVVTFQGFNTHPGFARDRMVNANKVAADFLARLPRDRMAPEVTSGREGFVHPHTLEGSVDRAVVKFIVRDFEDEALGRMEREVETLARAAAAAWKGATVSVEVKRSYRNFRKVLDTQPHVADNAREAIRRAGIEPFDFAIRGGTDGSRLSEMGLPCPNLFAGGHNFHSRLEWVSVQDMEKAVEVIVNTARIFEERA